jgi:hypothetical protein
LVTWVYDEIGCAGAILDEFCLRNLSGDTVGWVFGLSVFSLKGEHIGWFEDGALFDVDNKVLGFVPGAVAALELPALAPEPPMPVLSKRPYVPTLRGRTARARGTGWSAHSLASYLAHGPTPVARAAFMPRIPGGAAPCAGEHSC